MVTGSAILDRPANLNRESGIAKSCGAPFYPPDNHQALLHHVPFPFFVFCMQSISTYLFMLKHLNFIFFSAFFAME
jgi:hypothetical protein